MRLKFFCFYRVLKKASILLIIPVFAKTVSSQDLIVTNEGDSLNCIITKEKKGIIYFSYIEEGETMSTLIEQSQTTSYVYDYFQNGIVDKDKIIDYDNFQHFRFLINSGYSYNQIKIEDNKPPAQQDYVRGLNHGFHIGGDFNYYFAEQFGFGCKYIFTHTASKVNAAYFYDSGVWYYVDNLSQSISINYIGPSFIVRLLNNSGKLGLFMSISMGYMGYSNRNIFNSISSNINSSTVAAVSDIGYDFALSENISFGIQVSSINGTLTSYKQSFGSYSEEHELNSDNKVKLNRFDISLGIRHCL